MTTIESQHFIFDGISSAEMGLSIIRLDTDFVESPYLANKSIIEEQIFRRNMPFFYGVEQSPLEFKLKLSLLDEEWTQKKRYEIARWLFHDTYKSFQTGDDLGKFYYVICVDQGNLYTVGKKGYVELTFRNNAPFAWAPPYIDHYNLSYNTTKEIIQIANKSNINEYYYPDVEFQLIGKSTGISLKNLSDCGRIFSFNGLQTGEIISIDNKNKYIISDNPLVYRFANFNKNWFRLVYGVNQIEVTGKCDLKIRMQFPIIQ